MSNPTILGRVKGARCLRLVRNALFNTYGLTVYGISINASDTIFEYQLQTDAKLTACERKHLPEVCAFVKGFASAIQATE